MSLVDNLVSLIGRMAGEFKAVRTLINNNATDLSGLNTTNKANLVAALNELHGAISAASGIDDDTTSTGSTWSSQKILGQITAAIDDLVAGAPAALDTLKELADAWEDADSEITGILTALTHRVRTDAAQSFAEPQKAQARSNIGAAAVDHSHDNVVASGASGFMTGADKAKLDGIAAGANNYVHPTTDGNRHVPATTAGDVNKFLKSGATPGSNPTWVDLDIGDTGTDFVALFEAGLL